MAEVKASISVEKLIHDHLKNYAEHILKNYGLKIEDVSFSWFDEIGGGGMLYRVDVHTRSIE